MAKKKKKAAKKAGGKKAKKAGAKKAKKATGKKAKKAGGKKAKKAAPKAKKAGKKVAKKSGGKKTAKAAPKKAPKKKKTKAPKPKKVEMDTSPMGAEGDGGESSGDFGTSDDAGSESSDEEGGRGLSIGDDAPGFTLPVVNGPQGGSELSLRDFAGRKNVLLYFYPKDDTPGCTKQACTFQEDLSRYEDADTVVLGVSGDGITSHTKFANKYGLKFPLLADLDNQLAKQYGVWVEKNMYGRTYMGVQRATFLIDKKGRLARAWPKVKVDGHSEDVLAALSTL